MGLGIHIENARTRDMLVMVFPNEDYQLTDLFVNIATTAYGAYGIINSAANLYNVLRIMNLTRSAVSIKGKIEDMVRRTAIHMPYRAGGDVYDMFRDNPTGLLSISGIASLFGGKTMTVLITDKDFKDSVMFNTELNTRYKITLKGVVGIDRYGFEEGPLHRWNKGGFKSGILSSAPPTLLVTPKEEMLLFTRDPNPRGANGIFCHAYTDGRFVKSGNTIYTGFDAEGGVAPTMMDEKPFIVAQHANGQQMFAMAGSDEWCPYKGYRVWMGPDIKEKPSATTMGRMTVAVALGYNGNMYVGWEVWFSMLEPKGSKYESTKRGRTGFRSKHPPAVHAYKGKFYLFFTNEHKDIVYATSENGHQWTFVGSIGHRTSAGVDLTVFKEKLYVFFRDHKGNGVFYAWSDDGKKFQIDKEPYFNLDIDREPTASPIGNKIMVAGYREYPGEIIYTFLGFEDPVDGPDPHERPKPPRSLKMKVIVAAAKREGKPVAKSKKKLAKKTMKAPAKKAATGRSGGKVAAKPAKKLVKTNVKAAAKKPAGKVKTSTARKAVRKDV